MFWHGCNSEWVSYLCSWDNCWFETNIDRNSKWEANKYKNMLKSLENEFEKVNFVNRSMWVLGIVGTHNSVTNMLKALGFQQQEIAYLIKKDYMLLYKKHTLYFVWEIRHGVSLVFFPGDVPLVALSFLDTMLYSCEWSGVLKWFVLELLFRKIKNFYYYYYYFYYY